MKIFRYTAVAIITFCLICLFFVLMYLFLDLLRDGILFLLGTRWYDLNVWRWQYIVDLGKLLVWLLAPTCAWYIKIHVQIWIVRRKVIVRDDSIADYSPKRALPRMNFSDKTKDEILRRTLRRCGNKLLCFYTGRPVCTERQINLNGFKPGDVIHFDHVIPPKYGGDNSLENCVITSRDVNLNKHDDIKEPYTDKIVEWLRRHGKTIHEDCLKGD